MGTVQKVRGMGRVGEQSSEAPTIVGHSPKGRRVPFYVSLLNPLMKGLLRVGVPLGAMTLITVKGRRTGRPRTTPVGLLEMKDGRKFVFGTFGNVNWVRNLRTAGEAVVGRGRRRGTFLTRELGAEEAAVVLKQVLAPYLSSRAGSAFLKMGYELDRDASAEDYLREARRHPGFEIKERVLE